MTHTSFSAMAVRRSLGRALVAIALALFILGGLHAGVQSLSIFKQVVVCNLADNVGGVVYQDYNASGARNLAGPVETGVAGVTVTAYDHANTPLDSTTSASDGSYVLSVPNGTNVRVEFTNFPAGFFSGPFGSESSTSVTFVQSPDCTVDLGVYIPSYYCQDNPDLATSCYAFGDQLVISNPVLVSFPFAAGSNTTNPLNYGEYDQPPATHEAEAFQIGTTYGLAYQPASDNLFAAAFMKRHSGFGPSGTGAIYKIDMSLPISTPGRVTTFVDLNALFGAGTAGIDPHGGDYSYDSNSWDAVGKISLGDIDLSEDELTLWAVNLTDRRLYEIPIGIPPTPPTAGNINRFDIPLPADCPTAATNARPFGTGTRGNLVYVGIVCTAETTQNAAQMRGYVYSFNPATSAFSQVLNFPLNYPRSCAVRNFVGGCGMASAQWRPWVTSFRTITTPFSQPPSYEFIYPQPWLTDIVFDNNGDMILGLRDRYGDQMGYLKHSTNPLDLNLYTGDSAGDALRACLSGGVWTLENNGLCGGRGPGITPGSGTGPGTPGGEYYYQENYRHHDETFIGGIAQVPGRPEVVANVYDPISDTNEAFQGGTRWMDNATGAKIKSYRVFTTVLGSLTFGKANGLGDLEALCNIAPIEIGNRVWRDRSTATRNGRQDASIIISSTEAEIPIPNVTVHLYLSGTLIATDATDGNGEYIFNDANVPGGLKPFTTYTIRLDDPANYLPLAPLDGLTLTLSNVPTVPDTIDNDGVLGNDGFPEIVAVTRNYGDNDHTFDFGFYDDFPPTAVGLLYFRVDRVTGRQVHLAWATETEIDNFGFNLYRAPANDVSRASLIHFEPSAVKGSGPGAVYAYVDSVPFDGVWWYWLADVDTQGRETWHQPAPALVGPNVWLPYRILLPFLPRR